MSYLLQTNHLTKIIGGKELRKGEIYGFLGPNGAGKTSVMKMLTNLWKPTEGAIELFGETLQKDSYEVLKRMGSIIEFPVFYERMSGRENLQLHCEYMGYYEKGCVEKALELLSLSDAANKPVKKYSLGMKQRLGIARAVLSRPELLILDEPANGLDPSGMKQIRELFKMLCKEYGITLMISTHILSEIESIADTVGVISRGKLLEEISMKEIRERNLAYIELSVENTRKTAYILTEQLGFGNFKIMDERNIRIYEEGAVTGKITNALAMHGVEINAIGKKTETLEDYFLKMTEEGEAYA